MYLAGFGNHHQSEAVPGALPEHQNSPQNSHLNLYAEQLNGSAFTRPRHTNLHSWLYRVLPSVVQGDYSHYSCAATDPLAQLQPPNPMRWSARPEPLNQQDFVDGLYHVAGNTLNKAYIYLCNQSMSNRFFSNRDGEMLFVPYLGKIRLNTEFGIMDIALHYLNWVSWVQMD